MLIVFHARKSSKGQAKYMSGNPVLFATSMQENCQHFNKFFIVHPTWIGMLLP